MISTRTVATGSPGGKKDADVPRLNQCFLCKGWKLESSLKAIEVPDQTGYVRKLACQECLDVITGNDAPGREGK